MNFIALIGIVDKIVKGSESSKLVLKVEKNNYDEKDDWYHLIKCEVPSNIIKDTTPVKIGDIVGIKGYALMVNNSQCIIGERLQVF